MSNTKSPLWKQLVGALAGAAVAFFLYEGYTFVSTHLEATLGVWPTGTLSFPAPDAVAIASSSSSSQSLPGRVMYGPFGWLRGAQQYAKFSSSAAPMMIQGGIESDGSAGASSSVAPTGALMGAQVVAVSSSSSGASSSDGRPRRVPYPLRTTGAPPPVAAGVMEEPAPLAQVIPPAQQPAEMDPQSFQEAQSSSSVVPAPVMPALPPPVDPNVPPVTASIVAHSHKLPRSGFGLDVLAVVAVGAVIGKKKAMAKL